MKWLKALLSSVKNWFSEKWKPILIIIGLAIALFALLIVPELQVRRYHGKLDASAISKLTPQELIQLQQNLITAENNARLTIAQVIGGIGLLLGLYATFKNVKIAQDNHRVALETLRVTEEGKLTERFSKAVEMLGSDKLDVKLGGIYALERIARDSLKDHWTVMEVLTAFIREQSRKEYKGYIPRHNEGLPAINIIEEDMKLREDIQVTLTVIGRRTWFDQEDLLQELNLMHTFLGRAALFGANLRNANLFKTNLTESILISVDLSKAVLASAILVGADLSYSILSGTNLHLAKLQGADLRTSIGLTWEQISEAVINESTKLPPELEERRKVEQSEKAAAQNQ